MWICYTIATFKTMKRTLSIAINRSELASATIGMNQYGYEYDTIGNRLWSADNFITNIYTANNVNQYTSILCASAPRREPAYDADGNMTFDGVLDYSYDAENRLVSISSNGITIVTNQYDHKGRRVRKVTPVSETTFLYDDWNLVYEREIVGAITNETFYYWGKDISGTLQGAGGVGGLLYLKRNGTIYVPHADAYGNIIRYTDTMGNIVASYTYGAFGNLLSASGPLAHMFRFLFSSKYFDVETGHYYYIGRYYLPSLMCWLTRDPILEEGGMNLYAFCGNNPVAHNDAFGYSIAEYLPFTSTILSLIDDWLGHIPGESPIDYTFVSPSKCKCNIEAAENECLVKVEKEAMRYAANFASGALMARIQDIIVTMATYKANARLASAFFVDGAIGLMINVHIASKISAGADQAKRENCSCSQYGF